MKFLSVGVLLYQKEQVPGLMLAVNLFESPSRCSVKKYHILGLISYRQRCVKWSDSPWKRFASLQVAVIMLAEYIKCNWIKLRRVSNLLHHCRALYLHNKDGKKTVATKYLKNLTKSSKYWLKLKGGSELSHLRNVSGLRSQCFFRSTVIKHFHWAIQFFPKPSFKDTLFSINAAA